LAKQVKNLARLVLFFTVIFILSVLIVTGLRYLLSWLDAARMIPALPFFRLSTLITSLRMAIPAALYIGMLFSLNYAARRVIPSPVAMPALFLLAVGFSLALSLAPARITVLGFAAEPLPVAVPTLGKSGIRLLQGDVSIVVLGDPADGSSPRIAAVPGEPLVYMAAPRQIRNTPPRLPPAPFHDENSSVVDSLVTDFTLTAEQLNARLSQGLVPFLIYLAAFCLLLVSFYQIFEISAWPLANLFLGAMVFRALLALQTFVDSDAIQTFIFFFLGRFIPQNIISPVLFSLLGLLVILYSALINAGRGRRRARYG
jgi:hypothetical protein